MWRQGVVVALFLSLPGALGNTKPRFAPDAGTVFVAENVFGDAVATLPVAVDAEGDTVTYSIVSGNELGLFTNTANVVFLDPSVALDYESATAPTVFTLTVRATDDGSPPLTDDFALTVLVDNRNEAPFRTSPPSFTFAEEQEPPTLVHTVSVGDHDTGDVLHTSLLGVTTYASNPLANATDTVFSFDPSTLTLTLLRFLDYDANIHNFTLTFLVEDTLGNDPDSSGLPPGPLSTVFTVVALVGNVNEAPVITSNLTAAVAELAAGASFYTITADDEEAGVLSFEIPPGTPYASNFTVHPSTGVVSTAVELDHEATPVVTVTLRVSDDGLPPPVTFTTFVLTVAVLDVNEPPVHTGPTHVFVRENLDISRHEPFHEIEWEDPDGDEVSFTLTGGDIFNVVGEAAFRVTNNGSMRSIALVDFEAGKTHFTMTMNMTDTGLHSIGGPITVPIAFNITLLDFNDIPVADNVTVAYALEYLPVGTVFHTVIFFDQDADNITYTAVGGTTDFAIRPNGDVVPTVLTDFEAASVYTMLVSGVDAGKPGGSPGLAAALNLTIVVVDRNDPPVWVSPPVVNFPEVVPPVPGTLSGTVRTASSASVVGSLVYEGRAVDFDTGDVLHYAITGNASDNANTGLPGAPPAFNMSQMTGHLFAASFLNFEAGPTEFLLALTVTDEAPSGGDIFTVPFALRVVLRDMNDVPVLVSPQAFEFSELAPVGITVYVTNYTDEDPLDTITFALVNNSDLIPNTNVTVFTIHNETGVITTAVPFDFETMPEVYHLQLSLTDDATAADDAAPLTTVWAVTATMVNGNEAPFLLSQPAFAFEENTGINDVVYTIVGGDPDSADTITYGIVDGHEYNGAQAFSVDPASGDVSVATAIDFETPPTTFNLTVTLTDDATAPGSLGLTLTTTVHIIARVVSVNEDPIMTSNATFSVAENATVGDVFFTSTLFDQDVNDTVTFAVVSGGTYPTPTGPQPAFNLGNLTGEWSPALNIDFETVPVFPNIVLELRDDGQSEAGAGSLATRWGLTIAVLDRNDPPWLTSPHEFTFFEETLFGNSPPGTVYHTLTAFDADVADRVTFSITGGNTNPVTGDPAFGVNATSGELFVASFHDFETMPRLYTLEVTLTDDNTAAFGAAPNAVPFLINATLLNVNEPPLFTTSPANATTLHERCTRCGNGGLGDDTGAVDGQVVFTLPLPDDPDDPEALRITYSIAEGNTAGYFTLGGTLPETLTIAPGAAVDFESGADTAFQLVIESEDDGAPVLTGTFHLNVTIIDVNEPPVWASPPRLIVYENPALDAVLYTAATVDVDAGDVPRYLIAGSPNHPANGTSFRMVAASGELFRGHNTAYPDGKPKSALSFEDSPSNYTLLLHAIDSGEPPFTIPFALNVTVLDINDTPLVDGPFVGLVDENYLHPPHPLPSRLITDPIYTIPVQDDDGGDAHRFELLAPLPLDPTGSPWLTFEEETGTFTATRELDFENDDPNSYFFEVMLLDDGEPPLNSTFTFEVRVVDANDSPEVRCRTRRCENDFIEEATSIENEPAGKVLYTFEVVDQDWAHSEQNHSYAVVGGDPNADFALADSSVEEPLLYPVEGWLRFDDVKDFEAPGQLNSWLLDIEVTDTGEPPRSTQWTFEMDLLNRNDPPIWLNDEVQAVPESVAAPGGAAFVANVTDQDQDAMVFVLLGGARFSQAVGDGFAPSPHVNASAGEDPQMWFVNATSGVISPVFPLSYEAGPLVYQVDLRAWDNGEPDATFTDFGVRLEIVDVNEPVVFTPAVVHVNVPKNARTGFVAYDIPEPYEEDLTPLYVVYALEASGGNDDGTFAMGAQDTRVATVVVAATPGDGFTHGLYNLTVVATDAGSPGDPLPVSAFLPIFATVVQTEVLEPVEGAQCFPGQVCPIVIKPSLLEEATEFFVQLADPETGEVVVTVGIVSRADTDVVNDGPLATFNWNVPVSVPVGNYTVRVASPPSGPDVSVGTSAVFAMEQPFGFYTSAYGDCVLPPAQAAEGCGTGTRTRSVLCVDFTALAYAEAVEAGTEEEFAQGLGYVNATTEFLDSLFAPNTVIQDVRPVGENNSLVFVDVELRVIPDSECGPFEDRPATTATCLVPCPDRLQYLTQPYGACTELCDGGVQTRDIICLNGTTGEEFPLTDPECPQPAPATMRECNLQSCNSTMYLTAWSHCSQNCFVGGQWRSARCLDGLGRDVGLEFCGGVHSSPDLGQRCVLADCGALFYDSPPFSACSEACSSYLGPLAVDDPTLPPSRTRSSPCTLASNGVVLDSESCEFFDVPPPVDSIDCNTQFCQAQGMALGVWSTCEAPCGGNDTQTRALLCLGPSGEELPYEDCFAGDIITTGEPAPSWVLTTSQVCGNTECVVNCSVNADCVGGSAAEGERSFCSLGSCACKPQWTGPDCAIEAAVPLAACPGLRDAEGSCCEGAVDIWGVCCGAHADPPTTGRGYVLDVHGECCFGELDGCGVCNGDGVAVDAQGVCCSNPLAASGLCCVPDDCGVCDGDNSCTTTFDVLMGMEGVTVGAALLDPVDVEFTLFGEELFEWVAPRVKLSPDHFRLVGMEVLDDTTLLELFPLNTSFPNAGDAPESEQYQDTLPNFFARRLGDGGPRRASLADRARTAPTAAALLAREVGAFVEGLQGVAPRARVAPPRRRTQTGSPAAVLSDGGTPNTAADAILTPVLATFDMSGDALVGSGRFIDFIDTHTLYNVSEAPMRVWGSVVYFTKAGACGNGKCESGEQCADAACSNAGGCRVDCPFSVIQCPAPELNGPVCSERGLCVPTTGACDCFPGYFGDACEQCAVGHVRVATTGTCVRIPEPSCGDNVMNGEESGVDCGRPCDDPCVLSFNKRRDPLPEFNEVTNLVPLFLLAGGGVVVVCGTVFCVYAWRTFERRSNPKDTGAYVGRRKAKDEFASDSDDDEEDDNDERGAGAAKEKEAKRQKAIEAKRAKEAAADEDARRRLEAMEVLKAQREAMKQSLVAKPPADARKLLEHAADGWKASDAARGTVVRESATRRQQRKVAESEARLARPRGVDGGGDTTRSSRSSRRGKRSAAVTPRRAETKEAFSPSHVGVDFSPSPLSGRRGRKPKGTARSAASDVSDALAAARAVLEDGWMPEGAEKPPTPPADVKNTQLAGGKPALQAEALGSEDARLEFFGGTMPLNDTQARLARERLREPPPPTFPRIVVPHPEYLDRPTHVPAEADVAVPAGFRGPSHGLAFDATQEAQARKARRRGAAWVKIRRKAGGKYIDGGSSEEEGEGDVALPAYMGVKPAPPPTTVGGVRGHMKTLLAPADAGALGGTSGGAGRFVGKSRTVTEGRVVADGGAAGKAGRRKERPVWEEEDGGEDDSVMNPLARKGSMVSTGAKGGLAMHTSPRGGGTKFAPRQRGKSEQRKGYRGGTRSKWRPPTPPSDDGGDDGPPGGVWTADYV